MRRLPTAAASLAAALLTLVPGPRAQASIVIGEHIGGVRLGDLWSGRGREVVLTTR